MEEISEFQAKWAMECWKDARERIMARIQRRDNLLRLHLVVQVGVLSFAGANMADPKSVVENALPYLIFIAPASAFCFVLMYMVEDLYIAHQGRYIGWLSQNVRNQITSGDIKEPIIISNWDNSGELLVRYFKKIGPLRRIIQWIAFFVFPALLSFSIWELLPTGAIDFPKNKILAILLLLHVVTPVALYFLARYDPRPKSTKENTCQKCGGAMAKNENSPCKICRSDNGAQTETTLENATKPV